MEETTEEIIETGSLQQCPKYSLLSSRFTWQMLQMNGVNECFLKMA